MSNFWVAKGFEEISTGGGYVGYYKSLNDKGAHILVTKSEDETALPNQHDKCDVSFNDEDGHQERYYWGIANSHRAIAWIEQQCAF